jgi:hypothetical protein
MIVNAGLDYILDEYFGAVTLYVGLKGAGTIAAADTMASHAGWSEVTDYDEATRPGLTMGSASSQSIDNSASVAVFTISDTVAISGYILTTDNTIGGAGGTLISAKDFTASQNAVDDDVVEVTITFVAENG